MYFSLKTRYRTIQSLTVQLIGTEILNQRIQLDLLKLIKRDNDR